MSKLFVRVVFSRTFLVHVWRKCRGADCFYAGNVRLAPGISPNRRKLPSTRGCYLRSRGAAYILIMPSTFWVSTGLWLKMHCKTSWEITGAPRYQPVTRQASCLTDVKSALKLTPYCLHLLTLQRANKPKKLPSLNSLSVTSP